MITILGFLFATILCEIYKIDLGIEGRDLAWIFLFCLIFELFWMYAVGKEK